MNWFLFSLLGASSLAVTGVIDKLILEKYVKNSHAYLVALIFLQQVLAASIFLIVGPGFVYPHSLYAIAVGVVQIAYWAAYLRALKVEETSRIAALVYVYPVFVFPAAFFMLLFWIFYASYSISAKLLLSFMDGWHLMIWLSLGNLMAVLPFLLTEAVRSEICGYVQRGGSFFSNLLAEEIFSFLGRGALIFAYAVGSVALVSSVAALQPFFTLVYVGALSILMPGLLKDRRTLSLKLIAVFMIVIGIYLIS